MAVYKKSENWYIDYYVSGHRKREKIGPNRALAETVLKKRKVEIAEGRFLDIKKTEKIKFEDFANTYLELHSKPNKRSYKTDVTIIKNLTQFFGGRYLYEITPMLAEEYKKKRIPEVAPATINKSIAILKHMFNKAVEWEKLESNQLKVVKRLKVQDDRLRFLEKEEIKALLAAIAKLKRDTARYLKPIVIVALNTGMRKGEILRLKWKDIDINRNLIYIYYTKNFEKREIPINEIVKKTLIAVRKNPNSAYIFCNKDGKPYGDVKKGFHSALKLAGINDFRFHDLRHTFASWLVMSGIDLNMVRELLGHKSIEMTLRYSHLSPSYKKQAVDVLSRQMDTIWTPESEVDKIVKEVFATTVDNKRVKNCAPVAQMDRAIPS